MATEKKFAVAGVSTLNGVTKIRFANDATRVKILAKNDHKDVELIDLPQSMTKGEIAQYMIELGFGKGNPAIEAAIAYVQKKNPVAKTVKKTTAAKAEAVAA